MNKSFISSISVYVSIAVQMVFGFLTSVYVIRYLSVADYGAYKLLASIITFAVFLTSFGLEGALSRFASEYLSKENYKNVNNLLLVVLVLRVSAVFVFIGILVLLKYYIFLFLNLPGVLMTWLTAICILIFLKTTKSLFGTSFLASYLELYLDKINIIVISIIRFILFLLVLCNNWGLGGLILSMVVVDVFSFAYFLFLAIKKYLYNVQRHNPNLEKLEYRRIIRFSLLSYSGMLTGVFKEIMIDNFVISHYLNASFVGLYSFAAILVGIPRQLNPISILRGVFNPLLVKRYYTANGDKNILIFFFEFFNKLFFFICIPVFIGVGLLSKQMIILIYDPKYLQTLPIIYLLLISFSVGSLSYTLTPIINVLEKNELFFYSGIFSIYNLVLDILLVQKFGIMGAAIATGSALVLQYFYYFYFTRKLTKINFVFPIKSLFKSLFNLLPMIAFLLFFKHFITNLALLISAVFIAIGIHLIMSYFNKLFSERERKMINNAIGKKLWVF